MKKQMKIWSMIMLVAMVLPMMVACGSDDSNGGSINKSELMGTWYCQFTNNIIVEEIGSGEMVQYEIYIKSGSKPYSFNDIKTWKYSIQGNKLINDEGEMVTISIKGRTLTVSANNETFYYTKYDGTAIQFLADLNNK